MADADTTTPEPSGADQPPTEEPKIHVDSDWKKEAQVEKERLAREAETAEPSAAAGPEADDGQALPSASFPALVQMIATQAAIFMSDQRDPQTGRPIRHLDLAKHNIDLLGVLEEKTKGNLTDDEKKLLDHLLYELRMVYVSAAS